MVSVSGTVDSPYRGLSAFEEQDAPFFFGREVVAEEVLQRMSQLLDAPGLLIVSGASGVGKSSLLRAGVMPRLRAVGLATAPGSALWPCLVLTPGRSPLDELAVNMAALTGADAGTVRRELSVNPGGFAMTARRAALDMQSAAGDEPDVPPVARPSGERRLLLIIDQFEQVFTQCADEAERRAFIVALCAAVGTERGREGAPSALAVLVVRADFEAACANYPELAAAVQERYLVMPMTERQLRMAITQPARRADSQVDDDLAEVSCWTRQGPAGLEASERACCP